MAGHPLRPAIDRRLGEPLPHQQANRTRANPSAIQSFAHRPYTVLARVSPSCSVPKGMFPRVTHPSATHPEGGVRLACVKPAASVRSEPGSNSQVVVMRSEPSRSPHHHGSRHTDAHQANPVRPAPSRRVPNSSQPQAKARNQKWSDNVTASMSRPSLTRPASANPARNRKDTAVHVSLNLQIQLSNSNTTRPRKTIPRHDRQSGRSRTPTPSQ